MGKYAPYLVPRLQLNTGPSLILTDLEAPPNTGYAMMQSDLHMPEAQSQSDKQNLSLFLGYL